MKRSNRKSNLICLYLNLTSDLCARYSGNMTRTPAKLDSIQVIDFVMAGNATFTLLSTATGKHYTYKVTKSKDAPRWFVKVLCGRDNENDYRYIGMIQNRTFLLTSGSELAPNCPSVISFRWFFLRLAKNNRAPEGLEVWHAGRCCRCGRTLTVPESIALGLGPECAKAA